MLFQRIKTSGLGQNSYFLGYGDGQAIVIDARRDVDEYVNLAREREAQMISRTAPSSPDLVGTIRL